MSVVSDKTICVLLRYIAKDYTQVVLKNGFIHLSVALCSHSLQYKFGCFLI
jgi:hypothetical protein